MGKLSFEIVSAYDTETTNIVNGSASRAFPVLFIDNDLRGIDLYYYEVNKTNVYFYRTEQEMENRIDFYIEYGKNVGNIPIICAYNLMFDLQPMMYYLDKKYNIRVSAQSSTVVYTLDLYSKEDDTLLLRFWDTYHLEMRGLKAMGETAGLPKAVGDWDYSLIRTPNTPLTDKEKYYAARDTQVIPMYLRYLLHSNEWLKQSDLGFKVITKTSIVRQMARREIGSIRLEKRNGKEITLDKAFITKCNKQRPQFFSQYALRKACFRGGLTFTAARYASVVVRNVISLDVTSMHHTFINGRLLPEDFEFKNNHVMSLVCKNILNTKLEDILLNYNKPFKYAIHARVKFNNFRLKKNSCFDNYGIAILSTSKFKKIIKPGVEIGFDAKNVEQENIIRQYGWNDLMSGETIAFGKLYYAKECILNLSEIELWCVGQVYEWDSYDVLFGECTSKFRTPPDFVTLQSNILFEMKSKAKFISKNYIEGQPYKYDVDGIPDGIANELKNGTCSSKFFESWYISTVKGMFNGIYGTMAQDVYKPDYTCVDGELLVDENTKTTPENFDSKNELHSLRVMYTYGLRIVAGSRMHLIISMMLLYNKFGNKIKILGGDTDSLKCSLSKTITDDMVSEALQPIADSSKDAINKTMKRVRDYFPDKASKLDGIGSFDIENYNNHYDYHLELWNKCRVSWDGKAHVTCAGISRPINSINIETVINILAKKYPISKVLKECLGYNVCILPEISHSLQPYKPKAYEIFNEDVTDYLGNTTRVIAHQSTALQPSCRWIGESIKMTNFSSIEYLHNVYNRDVDTTIRYIGSSDGKVWIKTESLKVIMEAKIPNEF